MLFDINRMTEIEHILWEDPRVGLEELFKDSNLPFALSLVTNQKEMSRSVVVAHKDPDDREIVQWDIKMSWPTDVYSLSHVSLPISPRDPLYGISDSRKPRSIGPRARKTGVTWGARGTANTCVGYASNAMEPFLFLPRAARSGIYGAGYP